LEVKLKYVVDLLKENGYDLISARYYFKKSHFTVMDDRGYLFEESMYPLLKAAKEGVRFPLRARKKLGILNLKNS